MTGLNGWEGKMVITASWNLIGSGLLFRDFNEGKHCHVDFSTFLQALITFYLGMQSLKFAGVIDKEMLFFTVSPHQIIEGNLF